MRVPERTNKFPYTTSTASLNEVLDPRWWTRQFGFFGFLPLIPRFEGRTFGPLRDYLPYIVRVSTESGPRYVLEDRKALQWRFTEDVLLAVTYLLRDKFFIRLEPHFMPIPPSALGFSRECITEAGAHHLIARSRDWFVVWMGLLSFFIACIERIQDPPSDIPNWFSFLVARGEVDQTWLCGLHNNLMSSFKNNARRVGTFVDIKDKELPSYLVEWLCKWDVPVWYTWTTDDLCYCEARSFHHLIPPPEALQQLATVINKSPSPPQSPPHSSSMFASYTSSTEGLPEQSVETAPSQSFDDLQKARDAVISSRPWEPFFTARALHNARKVAKETPKDRQTRLNRERQPPMSGAEVFKWDWSDEDPLCLVRTRVLKDDRSDELYAHPGSQRRYDSVENQWDICEHWITREEAAAMARQEAEEDQEQGVDEYGFDLPSNQEGGDGPSSEAAQDNFNNLVATRREAHGGTIQIQSYRQDQSREIEVDLTPSEQIDVVQYLSTHFGYQPPLVSPVNSIPPDEDNWNEIVKTVGLRAGGLTPPPPNLGQSAFDFLRGFQVPTGPPQLHFDLDPHCLVPIQSNRLKLAIRKHNDNLFIVSPSMFTASPSTKWTIALTSARDAIKAFRELVRGDQAHSTITLARALLESGVEFRTLLPLTAGPLVGLQSNQLIPFRTHRHIYTLADYHLYVEKRSRILSSPCGRAALLAGGLVARIAREHIDLDSASFGPSSAVTSHQIGFHVDVGDVVYWDDMLTEDEINVLCGLHKSYEGQE